MYTFISNCEGIDVTDLDVPAQKNLLHTEQQIHRNNLQVDNTLY